MKQIGSFLIAALFPFLPQAQALPDKVYSPTIQTIKLFPQNDQLALPVITLNSGDQLELHFDDLVSYTRNYFYTYQLCNADWSETQWSPFDYIRGFQQNRISQYRISSIARLPYVHYQAMLPERSAIPSRSGNYLLKVYADGDPSKVVFTKRFYVVDQLTNIGARFQQPFDNRLSRTHQKIQLVVNAPGMNMIAPQQFKTVILQNGRWDDAAVNLQPAFIRGSTMEFNAEQDCIFPAGKEYRWADLQSFRFESDRIEKIDRASLPVQIFVKPDQVRAGLQYLYYRDRNGFDEIKTTEPVNPWWQSDYAEVNFSFVPERGQVMPDKKVYLVGELTGNQIGDTSLMKYDASKQMYTKRLLLKQGYYSYAYVTRDIADPKAQSDPSQTEGNSWETENTYTILVYFRSFGGRHDELIGYSNVNNFNLQYQR
ncbi:MAG TPA: DUF5103 domain-containing protein [Sediminibacterium sp.]|nr:DUF5103 domain-containing protein [Sediminibacterium sp.]